MRDPRVLIWPAGVVAEDGTINDATCQYRLLEPGRCLSDEGVSVTVDLAGPRVLWDKRWPPSMGNPPGDVNAIALAARPEADVVVLQRPGRRWWVQIIPMLQALGLRVVVDVDDAFHQIHPANASADGFDPRLNPHHNSFWISEACKAADVVTMTTPHLQGRYGFGHGVVLPNCVPERYLAIDHQAAVHPQSIGWAGKVETHPTDLQVTDGAVQRAIDKHPGWYVEVVGTGDYVKGCLRLKELPKSNCVGEGRERRWVPFVDYPDELTKAEVGIVPLADIGFNRGKCLDSATRIATRHGIVPIGEIAPGDQVWNDGRWRNVEAAQAGADETGYLLTTTRGRQLRLTAPHRLWANGQWTEARHIRVGDEVATTPDEVGASALVTAPWPSDGRSSRGAHDRQAFVSADDAPRVTITERWGRLLGLFAGDGAVAHTAINISCDGQDADLIELITDDCTQMGLWPSTQAVTTWGGEALRRRSVQASSTHLVRFMRSLGVAEQDRNRRVVCIPEVIWRSPKPVITAFLAGLFEADGWSSSSSIGLVTKHQSFALDVQRLLVAVGIESSVSQRLKRAVKGGERRPYWQVGLRRAAVDVFAKEVGFLSARKQARLAVITAKPHSNAYRPMEWTESIASIEECAVRPVDLQVEGSVFAAAGWVSHNSWLKMSEYAAVGVPVVASPTPDNVKLNDLGVGLLASSPNQWAKRLSSLMGNPERRTDLAERGREAMSKLTYEAQCGRWLEAWAG